LNGIIKDIGKCIILSIDIKSAFDSISRVRLKNIINTRFGEDGFTKIYLNLLDNLKLNIELSFTTVEDVKINEGCPQGLKTSCYWFIICMNYVVKYVNKFYNKIKFVL